MDNMANIIVNLVPGIVSETVRNIKCFPPDDAKNFSVRMGEGFQVVILFVNYAILVMSEL